ncbi:alpha-1,2-fucosyltransferase [Geomonas paludis]|uniref:Alpha-1,2-fucosyltransferase n=1 Tax=Geomonas paludis TaxID=2740185 RepID=A0A6V8MXF9_9BACT|nr:alpha-1,2-fucosyltransferase [Geomonas paludis]UPU34372.1 alpha-1,2-fucosyltransferase [Geomonas paludis]GFO64357.1 alpha-1,2-fucosyltransferase [Geomonas paludis]
MIAVRLMGGLGNQMFQYAAGRSLALRLGVELKLDLSFLEGDQSGNTPRSYALDGLSIAAGKATPWEIAVLTGTAPGLVQGVAARLVHRARGCVAFREKHFQVVPEFFSLPDNVHLLGYWQSERYFAGHRDVIRKEFAVKGDLAGRNLEMAAEIGKANAVSLHVRRGDYAADPTTRALHQVCDAGYYRAAEDVIAREVDNPHFFVFSDDPEWARENLELRHPATYVGHNGAHPHEDLRLMSLCRHHVIANSSFSWWGAWLATNRGQVVVAPSRWFNDPAIDTSDVTPAGWYRL